MSLMLHNSQSPLETARLMNRVFDRWFDDIIRPVSAFSADTYALPIDVQSVGDEFMVTAPVPGLKAEDLSVEVVGDVVTVSAELRAPESEEEQGSWLVRERTYGKFSRAFRVPAEIDSEKVEATLTNGVLTLHLPKAPSARRKAITVKTK